MQIKVSGGDIPDPMQTFAQLRTKSKALRKQMLANIEASGNICCATVCHHQHYEHQHDAGPCLAQPSRSPLLFRCSLCRACNRDVMCLL